MAGFAPARLSALRSGRSVSPNSIHMAKNGAVDRLCSCTGCPRRFSGVAVYWFQHDRKMGPTPGRAPGSGSYRDPASLSTLCRRIGGSGRIRTGGLLLMRELR